MKLRLLSARSLLARQQLRGVAIVRTILLIGVVAALVLFVIAASFYKQRMFTVAAETTSVEVVFKGEGNNWYLPEAVVCKLRGQPDLRVEPDDGACDSRFYEVMPTEDITLSWPDDAKVRVTILNSAHLSILLRDDALTNIGIPSGSVIVLTQKSASQAGTLTFTGELELGSQLASGERFFLSSGEWEARDTGLTTSLFRSNVTEVIKSGVISHGSSASVWAEGKPALMYGHMNMARNSSGAYLEVGAISRAGDVELRLGRFGLEEPAVIRPDLIDAAISSPILFAVAIVLSVLASATQVYADIVGRWSSADRSKNDQDKPV